MMTRVISAICQEPWAITEAALETIIAIAERQHEVPEALQKRQGELLNGARRTTLRGNTAILPILGPIFPRANLFSDISGATSLETLASDLAAAEDDPTVRQIVLDIDSPGGQVTGVAEFAELIANATKPVTAYVSGSAQSAAYWIASQADEIVVSPTAGVGSIGAVIGVYAKGGDDSVIEFVSSQSPMKRADPATDDGRAEYQGVADALGKVFVETVAQGRGVDVETVLTEFGRGGTRVGAQAVALGMADRVASAETVIAGFSRDIRGTTDMSDDNTTVMTQEQIASEHPEIASAFRQEGREQGAANERDRIQGVFAQSMPGHEDLIQTLAFDGKTTGPEAAVQVLNAERGAQTSRLAAIEADGEALDVPTAAADRSQVSATAPVEERCKAQWDTNSEIRAEFGGNFDSFLAFERANERGQVKQLKNRKEG